MSHNLNISWGIIWPSCKTIQTSVNWPERERTDQKSSHGDQRDFKGDSQLRLETLFICCTGLCEQVATSQSPWKKDIRSGYVDATSEWTEPKYKTIIKNNKTAKPTTKDTMEWFAKSIYVLEWPCQSLFLHQLRHDLKIIADLCFPSNPTN